MLIKISHYFNAPNTGLTLAKAHARTVVNAEIETVATVVPTGRIWYVTDILSSDAVPGQIRLPASVTKGANDETHHA